MRRKINWIAVVVFVLFITVLCITLFSLRLWRKTLTAKNSLQTGLQAYDQKQWTQAVKEFGRYLAANPEDAPILYKYAEARLKTRPLKREDIQQSIAAYRSILRTDGNHVVAVEHLINLYLQLQIASEAELIARQYLKTNTSPHIQTLLAISLTQQRKYAEACELLLDIMETSPDEIPVYEILADITEQRPELLTGTMDQWYEKAVTNNPESASARVCRAMFYLKKNQPDLALDDLETATQLETVPSTVRLQIAHAFISLDQFKQARTQLQLVLAEEPQNRLLWETWAEVALASGSQDEMEYAATTGIRELEPDMWDFLPTAGELLISCGQYNRVEDLIQKLYEKDFDPLVIYRLQARLAEAQNDPYEAIKSWTQAYQAGDTSEALSISLAKAYQNTGDTESAIRHLRQLIFEQPDSVLSRLELARILSHEGRWEEAVELTRRAVRLAPNNRDAALLNIRTRIQLLDTADDAIREVTLDRLENELAALEAASKNTYAVRLTQFELAMYREQFDSAELIINQLKNQNPDSVSTIMAECKLRVEQDNIQEAIVILNEAMKQFPLDVSIIENLAYLYVLEDNQTECRNLLQKSIQTIENPVQKRQLVLYAASVYNQWKQPEQAEQLLTEVARQLPRDIPIRRELIRFLRIDGYTETIQKVVDQIKSIEGPDGWQWRYEQANVWSISDNFRNVYPQIIALLKENLVYNPADQQSRMLLAATYEKGDNIQLALTTCKDALNRSPDDFRIILPVVSIMNKAGEYDDADKILTRIADQRLFRPKIARLELQSSIRKGNLESAETIISDMAAQDPENTELGLSLALIQVQRQKYDEALKLLRKLRTVQPDSMPILAALTDVHLHQQNYESALEICNAAVKQNANAAAYILRGQTYLASDHIDEAKKDIEQALLIEPENARTWMASSEFYRLIGQTEKAVSDMDKALTLDPDNNQIQKRMIALLLSSKQTNQIQRAEQIIDRAQSSGTLDTELQLYKIRCLMLKQDPSEIENARQMLLTLTEEQPKTTLAWVLLSNIYLDQHSVGKAMETVLQGLAYLPNDTQLLLVKARIEASQSPAIALSTLTLLYDQNPGNREIVLELAKTYNAAGQYDECLRLFKKDLEQSPGTRSVEIQLQYAIALYKNGQLQQSEQLFDTLYQDSPGSTMVLAAETDLLIKSGQWETLKTRFIPRFETISADSTAAETVIRKLLESGDASSLAVAETLIQTMLNRNPDSPEANKALAILYQIKGSTAKSAEIYARILEMNPDDLVALNNLAWILCEQQGDYQQALKLAEQGLGKTPNYPDLIDTRGVIYYRMANYQKAIEDFSRCAEMYPDNSASMGVTYFHLGRVFAKLEQSDRAIENLKQCLIYNQKYGGLSEGEHDEAQGLLANLSLKLSQTATYAN